MRYTISNYIQLFCVLAVIVGGQETSEQRILLAKRPHVIVGKLCGTIYVQLNILIVKKFLTISKLLHTLSVLQ